MDNARFISHHRAKPNPVDDPESSLTFAFGSSKFNKIVVQMKSDDMILRKKCLEEINEDFHSADKLNEALDHGILM